MKFLLSISLIATAVIFNSCDSACCQDLSLSTLGVRGNQTPVPIIAGIPAEITCGTTVIADGRPSYDPDGQIVQYNWTIDNIDSSQLTSMSITLPCDNQAHKICLEVVDDKNASQEVCRFVTVVDQMVNINKSGRSVKEAACNLVPKITFEKVDSTHYEFHCNESSDNGTPLDKQTANECQWFITKTFTDGGVQHIPASKGSVKPIDIDPETFKAMDVTLSVQNAQCEKSMTERFFLPEKGLFN